MWNMLNSTMMRILSCYYFEWLLFLPFFQEWELGFRVWPVYVGSQRNRHQRYIWRKLENFEYLLFSKSFIFISQIWNRRTSWWKFTTQFFSYLFHHNGLNWQFCSRIFSLCMVISAGSIPFSLLKSNLWFIL